MSNNIQPPAIATIMTATAIGNTNNTTGNPTVNNSFPDENLQSNNNNINTINTNDNKTNNDVNATNNSVNDLNRTILTAQHKINNNDSNRNGNSTIMFNNQSNIDPLLTPNSKAKRNLTNELTLVNTDPSYIQLAQRMDNFEQNINKLYETVKIMLENSKATTTTNNQFSQYGNQNSQSTSFRIISKSSSPIPLESTENKIISPRTKEVRTKTISTLSPGKNKLPETEEYKLNTKDNHDVLNYYLWKEKYIQAIKTTAKYPALLQPNSCSLITFYRGNRDIDQSSLEIEYLLAQRQLFEFTLKLLNENLRNQAIAHFRTKHQQRLAKRTIVLRELGIMNPDLDKDFYHVTYDLLEYLDNIFNNSSSKLWQVQELKIKQHRLDYNPNVDPLEFFRQYDELEEHILLLDKDHPTEVGCRKVDTLITRLPIQCGRVIETIRRLPDNERTYERLQQELILWYSTKTNSHIKNPNKSNDKKKLQPGASRKQPEGDEGQAHYINTNNENNNYNHRQFRDDRRPPSRQYNNNYNRDRSRSRSNSRPRYNNGENYT
ncbi:MAG: hypothetical protein ACXWFC_10710, partial [Nitrososphaeraceae archaeon]